MIEHIFEFSLCIIDAILLLIFFCKLSKEKISLSRLVFAASLAAVLQYTSEFVEMNKVLRGLLEDVFIICYLLFYSRSRTRQNFLYAVSVNILFTTTVVISLSILSLMNIDVNLVMNFGIERAVFCGAHILFAIIVFICILQPLSKLHNNIEPRVFNRIVIAITIMSFCLNYILQLSEQSRAIVEVTCITVFVLLLTYYVVLRYYVEVKKTSDMNLIRELMQHTEEHILLMEEEHQEVRKLRHDMQNQLLVIHGLCEHQEYSKLNEFVRELVTQGKPTNQMIETGSTFLDVVMNQKKSQFPNIKFVLDIKLSKDFSMNSRDLTSMFVNIIDNACEALNAMKENVFTMKVRGDKTALIIKQSNACTPDVSLKSNKSGDSHGYGLKIIKSIVEKYHGTIDISTKPQFTLDITLFF